MTPLLLVWGPPLEYEGLISPEHRSCSGLNFQVVQLKEQESVKGDLRVILGAGRSDEEEEGPRITGAMG